MAKILCVEDEELIRKLVVEELADEGHETIEASNGEEGLAAIMKYKPDLVLCDVNMPGMGGYQLLTTLRENHPELADMPFIYLSALADRKDVIGGRKLGADDYLTKPIDFEMLLNSVETRLNQVNRMEARKQGQMVKLYKALSGDDDAGAEALLLEAKPEVKPKPEAEKVSEDDIMTVAIVCNDEVDLTEAEEDMIKAGHAVKRFSSGKEFQRAINDLNPNMLLISFDTADAQAPFLMKVLGGKDNVAFGSVVFVPPNLKHMCGTTQTLVFDAFVKMPASRDQILETIDAVFKVRRQAAKT
ncbi:MAG: response regulator [Rhodospirillales bacterium]|nr:response regulator [Rhodospirillales bacterium]